MNVIPSFSSVCLDLSSIPLMVRHNLVLSVLLLFATASSVVKSVKVDVVEVV